ncbi:MAG: class I SAM-dependent methyltransferase [Woeseia sp.]|nr:class I SAM-dependent methyltransferase [Woeseia sp.]
MNRILQHDDAQIEITCSGDNRLKIMVNMKDEDVFVPFDTWETEYPVELIEKILNASGPAYLCEYIMREERPDYVENSMRVDVLSYVNAEQLRNMTMLDFGCGCGASTMILSRMFPHTQITGVDLREMNLEVARLRAAHYNLTGRTNFRISPDGGSLPDNIGSFDCIFLNAVYEHLLPSERKTVLPLLWKHLKPGGLMFINQTPYRWFPVESHTSGLALINYLPDRLAFFYFRHFSPRYVAGDDWPILLRKGIRGGSIREIRRILRGASHAPVVLEPERSGRKDRVDIWYAATPKSGHLVMKKSFLYLAKLIYATTGIALLPDLALAIKKSSK